MPGINAGAMRAKGLLEMAAAFYETSSGDVANRATITLAGRSGTTALTLQTGGLLGVSRVARRQVDVGWINPMAGLAMAYRGKGRFYKPQALRTLANFPSYDQLVFAVHPDTGIESLDDLVGRRYPLRVGTRVVSRDDTTIFAVAEVLRFHGCSLRRIEGWGGEVQHHPSPSHRIRIEAIQNHTVDAIFDEGIPAWGEAALAAGMKFLPFDERTLGMMEGLGFRRSTVRAADYPGLGGDLTSIDFSGWPIYAHASMPDDVAYALCAAIEARQEAIPVDQEGPLGMAQLCNDSEACPLDVPLHPGAERFYREHGYLK